MEMAGLIVASARQPHRHHAGPRRPEARLAAWAEARGAAFVSDEIYHGLHYGDRAVSALEISDEAWVINSFPSISA
jgi:aspartate/methionine/tyrosine aminotransferase